MRCAQPRRRTQRNQNKSNVVPVPRFGAVRNHGGTRNATKKQTQMALRYAGSGLCAVRNHDGTRSATKKKWALHPGRGGLASELGLRPPKGLRSLLFE